MWAARRPAHGRSSRTGGAGASSRRAFWRAKERQGDKLADSTATQSLSAAVVEYREALGLCRGGNQVRLKRKIESVQQQLHGHARGPVHTHHSPLRPPGIRTSVTKSPARGPVHTHLSPLRPPGTSTSVTKSPARACSAENRGSATPNTRGTEDYQRMGSATATEKLMEAREVAVQEMLRTCMVTWPVSGADAEECAVCSDSFCEIASVRWPNCGHYFCVECIHQLTSGSRYKCPVCHESVIPASFSYVRAFRFADNTTYPITARDCVDCPELLREGNPVITYPQPVFEIISQFVRLGCLMGDYELKHLREALHHAQRLKFVTLVSTLQDIVLLKAELGTEVKSGNVAPMEAKLQLDRWPPPPPMPRFIKVGRPRVTTVLEAYYQDHGIRFGVEPTESEASTGALDTPAVSSEDQMAYNYMPRTYFRRMQKLVEKVDDGVGYEKFHEKLAMSQTTQDFMLSFSVSELSALAQDRGLSSRGDTIVGDFGGTATTESASHHNVHVVVDRDTGEVITEPQYRDNIRHGIPMRTTCWFTTRRSTEALQSRQSGALTNVGRKVVRLRRQLDYESTRMDPGQRKSAARQCHAIQGLRIGLASIGGISLEGAERYATTILNEIQQQVGAAATKNARFIREANGDVSLVLDLDMRCLQVGQLGAGLTLVVSEPHKTGADADNRAATVHVHTDPDAGLSFHASVSQGTTGGDCALIPADLYPHVKSGARPVPTDGPRIKASGDLHCLDLRQGHVVTPIAAAADQSAAIVPKRVACIQSTNRLYGKLMDSMHRQGDTISCVLLTTCELVSLSAVGLLELSDSSAKVWTREPTRTGHVAGLGGRWDGACFELLQEAATRDTNRGVILRKIRSVTNRRNHLQVLASTQTKEVVTHVRLEGATPQLPSPVLKTTKPERSKGKRSSPMKSPCRRVTRQKVVSTVELSTTEFEQVAARWLRQPSSVCTPTGERATDKVSTTVEALQNSRYTPTHTSRPQVRTWVDTVLKLFKAHEFDTVSDVRKYLPMWLRALLALLACCCRLKGSGKDTRQHTLPDFSSFEQLSRDEFVHHFSSYYNTIEWLATLTAGPVGEDGTARYWDVYQLTTFNHMRNHRGKPLCRNCKPGGSYAQGRFASKDVEMSKFVDFLCQEARTQDKSLPVCVSKIDHALRTKVFGVGKVIQCHVICALEAIGVLTVPANFLPGGEITSQRGTYKLLQQLGFQTSLEMTDYLSSVAKPLQVSALTLENIACKVYKVLTG